MSNEPTADAIHEAVARAIQQAKTNSGGERLLPFTAAEVRFIQDVVTGALSDLLRPGGGRG